MKKGKFIRQLADILMKIFSAFIIVFILYFTTKIIKDFAYTYFVFPLISIVIIFVCGINVGRSLEKVKRNEPVGCFTKKIKVNNSNLDNIIGTEFIVKDTRRCITNKKILKEVEDGDKIHVKVTNYNEIIDESEN